MIHVWSPLGCREPNCRRQEKDTRYAALRRRAPPAQSRARAAGGLMHADRDIIAIRADEQFDYQAMQAYLRTHLPHAEGTLEVWQFGGGHANLTYLLRLGEQEWVMRRPPLGPTLPTAHDMRREFRVLSALVNTDGPVPRPVMLCGDRAVPGVPFYLMERRRGIVIRAAIPPDIGDDLAKRRQGSEAVVDTLAAP